VHYYHERNLASALTMFEKARQMGAASDDLGYKIGYIHYDNALAADAGGASSSSELQKALTELHRVAQSRRDNPSALDALANTLYLRGDHFAAQGYYSQLLRQLEARRQRLSQGSPQEDAGLRRLLELTMRTYNNLGVNEKKLSQDTRSANRESRALYYLSRSIEFHDQMMREPETMARSEARNLGFLNSRAIMYPQARIELEIYREIPLDLEGQGL
jgi:Tfp pilus assembly protein PilF